MALRKRAYKEYKHISGKNVNHTHCKLVEVIVDDSGANSEMQYFNFQAIPRNRSFGNFDIIATGPRH